MNVYVTKKHHGKYNYLLNWRSPETGVMFGDWFVNMKDLKEYVSNWNVNIVKDWDEENNDFDWEEYQYLCDCADYWDCDE